MIVHVSYYQISIKFDVDTGGDCDGGWVGSLAQSVDHINPNPKTSFWDVLRRRIYCVCVQTPVRRTLPTSSNIVDSSSVDALHHPDGRMIPK